MVFVQFPHQQLQALGADLQILADELGSDGKGAVEVHGLDEQDHQRIRAALAGFTEEWESSRVELTDHVGETGKMADAVGKLVQSVDDDLAGGMRGQSS